MGIHGFLLDRVCEGRAAITVTFRTNGETVLRTNGETVLRVDTLFLRSPSKTRGELRIEHKSLYSMVVTLSDSSSFKKTLRSIRRHEPYRGPEGPKAEALRQPQTPPPVFSFRDS